MIKNKKADSRLLSPWLFFVLALIGVAIVGAVVVFFSSSTDVRIPEAKTISDRLIYAISDNGYIREESLGGFDILNNAGIDNRSMDSYGYFYYNVTIFQDDISLQSYVGGNIDFEIQCRLNGDKFAKCYEREFVLLDKNNSSAIYRIKILTGSNNHAIKPTGGIQ